MKDIRRCHACLTPCRDGWAYCESCHAYNDLAVALDGVAFGLNDHRLQRARRYFAGRRYVEPLESVVSRLIRRIAELENAVVPAMNQRVQRIECEMELE